MLFVQIKKPMDTFGTNRLFKIGRGSRTTEGFRQPHDIIGLHHLSHEGIFPKVRDLYESGSSLREIAKELGVTRHIARVALIKHGVGLRPSNRGLKGVKSKTMSRHFGAAPYGYFVLKGRLVEDNREQQTVQLIMKLWSEGKSYTGIARHLNEQNIKTRMRKKWDHSTVGNTIKYQSKYYARK